MYYASIGVLSLIIHVIINFEALKKRNSHRVKLSQVRYRHFLYAVMLFYISDILWGWFYEQRWIVPTYIDTMLFFISMGASVLIWTRFVVAFIDNQGRFGVLLKAGGWMIFTFQLVTRGWWYSLDKENYLSNGWKKIDGKWYYFKESGYIAVNEFVRGWWINKNGIQSDPVHYGWHKTDTGWWYGANGGWYAKGKTYIIDGKSYAFDRNGYME